MYSSDSELGLGSILGMSFFSLKVHSIVVSVV